MFGFIIQWKDLIIYAFLVLLAIIQVILVIVKKPVKVVDDIREIILEVVPKAINYVEDNYPLFKGDDKFYRCLWFIQDYLIEVKGYSEDVVNEYCEFISNSIELVLSTPQKKKGGI